MASHSHTHKTRRTISIEAPSEFRMIFDSAGFDDCTLYEVDTNGGELPRYKSPRWNI
ncbi:predicted protein [Botrytis cinerea T4]|uniref:Uncharacterized protein n=1 Tax=Botryotinia fuckeliana (strain T4) TaxID=999810 RepID=G2Y8V1_BOTF4|nr:predicted protein [Botrytis cinerea T4]